MRRSRQRNQSRQRRRQRNQRQRSRRGGAALVGSPYIQSDPSTWGNANYYPYNETPRLFTDAIYNDQQYIYSGGSRRRNRRGGDNSLYVWSQPLTNMTRSLTYGLQSAVDSLQGHYPGVNPSVLDQPI